MQRQMILDLQQQHRAEVAALLEERDKLLQEETAATMAGKRLQQAQVCAVLMGQNTKIRGLCKLLKCI